MNFGDIQNRVAQYILEDPPNVSDLIPVWINEAIREAEDHFNFRHMAAEQSYTTADGQRKLGDLPNRFKKPREFPFRVRDDGDIVEIDLTYDLSSINRRFSSEPDSGGEPLILFIEGSEIKVYPEPDDQSDYSDGNYRVQLPFWQFSAELQSTSETNWWTDNFPFYLIHKAAAEGLIFIRDVETASIHVQKAQTQYRRAKFQDGREPLPDNLTLVPRHRAFSAPRRPRGDIR